MNEYAASLLGLPGTAEEQKWLREHLETLSVKEGIILAAAMAREPPQDMPEAVNCLLSLDDYEVLGHAGSYQALGERFLFEHCVPQNQRAYFDLTALGELYEDTHPGLFIEHCYVEYPGSRLLVCYDGRNLPEPDTGDWSVRLKLASESVPEGVWLRLDQQPTGMTMQ